MTRQPRLSSQSGIYHVMLRGVNRQQIFEDDDDYRKFIMILHDMTSPKDELKRPLPPRCAFYAYCFMPNHVHLLIQEKEEKLSKTVKQIASRYAMYYNNKYEHFGHLFQDRFKSEPVESYSYFLTLIRYIHQNPVAGRLCQRVEDYDWSSWAEYTNAPNRVSAICAVTTVLGRIPLDELREQVHTPLPKAQQVLDFDRYRGIAPTEAVIDFLKSAYQVKDPKDLKTYPKVQRDEILQAALDFGAGINQLSCLTSISTYIISRAGVRPKNLALGSGPETKF